MRSMRRLVALAFFASACTQPSTTEVGATPPPSPVPRPAEAPQPELEPAPIEPVAKTAATLQYVEIVLGDAEPDAQLPMIVAIHGLGDRPADFAHLFDTFVEPARLILPQGVDATEGGGYSWFPLRARDADIEGLAQGIATASDRIADAITVLR